MKKKHRIRRVVLLALLLYAAAALLPYALVPICTRRAGKAEPPEFTSCTGERATILTTGEQALHVRMNMIANAQRNLVVGTYLLADDDTGYTIAAALLDAADRGVEVRILIDGLIGGYNLLTSDLGRTLAAHDHIELRSYNPVDLLKPWTINACYHEKYVIADGQVMVLGGRNISNEFLTPEDHPAYNYDMDILICAGEDGRNAPAEAITAYFDALWDAYTSPTYPHVPESRADAVAALRAELAERYTAFGQAYPDVLAPVDLTALTTPIEGFALLTNPTEPTATEPVVWNQLVGLMHAATRRVWIQTPYLVLSQQMRNDLVALGDLDAEVKLLTNSRAGGNNIIASADMLLRRASLLGMGIDLYTFQGNASMHTKALLVDDDVSVFGSFNFDMRSAYIDTEMMMAIRSEAINRQLEQHMNAMFMQALPMAGAQEGDSGVEPLEMPAFKQMVITILSPFVSLVHYLL